MSASVDVAIVGGGILGLATALALSDRYPGMGLVVLEKDREIARHQTQRNSGVLHSGLYYEPGSLKARLCRHGAEKMIRFCQEHDVPHRRTGKVVVAINEQERAGLDELRRRGEANGLRGLRRLSPEGLRELEPHAVGVDGLFVPDAGVVDFHDAAQAMARVLRGRGVEVKTSFEVISIDATGPLRLVGDNAELSATFLVNCAGLYADKVAEMAGVRPPVRIVPFRGEYYELVMERRDLVNGLIYPVPDPRFPFLGIHLTKTVHDIVHAGPNAVLALAREGYTWRRVSPTDLWNTLSYAGFRGLARRHWKIGLSELTRSLSTRKFVRAIQKLVPDVKPDDLEPGLTGVRAQAVSPAGDLVDDFSIIATETAVHVLNAPSPAATASLAIGEYVADRVADRLGIGGY